MSIQNIDEITSQLEASTEGFLSVFFAFFIVTYLFNAIIWARLFKKAGIPAILAFIPIVQFFCVCKVAFGSAWMTLLFLVPIAGFVMSILLPIKLSSHFGHGFGFAVGIFFLPIIFLPILAFGRSEYDPLIESDPAPSDTSSYSTSSSSTSSDSSYSSGWMEAKVWASVDPSRFPGSPESKEKAESEESEYIDTINFFVHDGQDQKNDGDYSAAVKSYELALNLGRAVIQLDECYEPPFYAICDELGKAYYKTHQAQKAYDIFKEALYYSDRCVKRDPGNSTYREDRDMIMRNMCRIYYDVNP